MTKTLRCVLLQLALPTLSIPYSDVVDRHQLIRKGWKLRVLLAVKLFEDGAAFRLAKQLSFAGGKVRSWAILPLTACQ